MCNYMICVKFIKNYNFFKKMVILVSPAYKEQERWLLSYHTLLKHLKDDCISEWIFVGLSADQQKFIKIEQEKSKDNVIKFIFIEKEILKNNKVYIDENCIFVNDVTHESIIKYISNNKPIYHKKSIYNWVQSMTFIPKIIKKYSNPFFYFDYNNCFTPIDIVKNLFNNDINKKYPLVSGVMVTKNRLNWVKKSIEYFLNQTYPNKELIIVEDGTDGTDEYIKKLKDPRIKNYHIVYSNEELGINEARKSLGYLRNFSIEKVTGEYLMQWDDDDYYHPTRIAIMMQKIDEKKVDVLYLSRWLMSWADRGYYTTSKYRESGWEGSMLIKTEKMLTYPSLKHGEDTVLQNKIKSNGTTWAVLDDYEMLYLYNIHGNNTLKNDHFQNLFNGTISLYRSKITNLTKEEFLAFMIKLTGVDVDNIKMQDPPSSNNNILYIFLIIIIIIIFLLLLYYLYRRK